MSSAPSSAPAPPAPASTAAPTASVSAAPSKTLKPIDRWTQAEHESFLAALKQVRQQQASEHAPFERIAQLMGHTKTIIQIKRHFKKYQKALELKRGSQPALQAQQQPLASKLLLSDEILDQIMHRKDMTTALWIINNYGKQKNEKPSLDDGLPAVGTVQVTRAQVQEMLVAAHEQLKSRQSTNENSQAIDFQMIYSMLMSVIVEPLVHVDVELLVHRALTLAERQTLRILLNHLAITLSLHEFREIYWEETEEQQPSTQNGEAAEPAAEASAPPAPAATTEVETQEESTAAFASTPEASDSAAKRGRGRPRGRGSRGRGAASTRGRKRKQPEPTSEAESEDETAEAAADAPSQGEQDVFEIQDESESSSNKRQRTEDAAKDTEEASSADPEPSEGMEDEEDTAPATSTQRRTRRQTKK